MTKNVLVTAIGTAASTTIVKELKKAQQFHIIGADMAERTQVATSLDVDEYFQFPPSVNEDYIPFALNFCKEHQVDYYFAIIDDEVMNIIKNRDSFESCGTKLCLPEYEFAKKCHYKEFFSEWIQENFPEIAIREYRDLTEIRNAKYPLFIKPHEGAASRGCRKAENYESLISMVDAEDIGRNILVQDCIEGTIITVDYIRNRKTGQTLQIQRKEILRNTDGCGIAVEIISNPALYQICELLMEKLDLNGVVNIEFFETKEGYRIIEINPRHSAGTVYSCMAGGDTVLNAVYIADGQPCVFGNIDVGAHFAKRYEAYRTS